MGILKKFYLGQGKFLISDIDVNICTHVVYAFAVLAPQKYTLKIFDQWLDIDLKNLEKFVTLKKVNPKLKTAIAIGGWTDSQNNKQAYKTMLKDNTHRSKFVT